MKLTTQLNWVTNILQATQPPIPSSGEVLDDFSSVRKNGDGTNLWQQYLGENGSQSGAMDTVNQWFHSAVTAVPSGSSGYYLYCLTRAGGYPWPAGYTQSFLRSGQFDPLCNRLSFWFRPNVNYTRNSNGAGYIELGTYIKSHTSADRAWQGAHYYHQFDPNLYAGKWHLFTINRTPQHQVGADPNHNWGDDPEWANASNKVHYFDGLTCWYFDFSYDGKPGTYDFSGPVQFATVSGEPDALVSSIAAVYTGSRYEVTWAGPKNTSQKFDVVYSAQSLRTNGWASGTPSGTVSSSGSAYTGCVWTGPATAQGPILYVGIKPQGGTTFTEVAIPQRL